MYMYVYLTVNVLSVFDRVELKPHNKKVKSIMNW